MSGPQSRRVTKHTILLTQTSPNRLTRTFMDFESVSDAMDGLCNMYEKKIKAITPPHRNISYDISDLYNFIDGFADMSVLVYEQSIQAYVPHDREWVKRRSYDRLKVLAGLSRP